MCRRGYLEKGMNEVGVVPVPPYEQVVSSPAMVSTVPQVDEGVRYSRLAALVMLGRKPGEGTWKREWEGSAERRSAIDAGIRGDGSCLPFCYCRMAGINQRGFSWLDHRVGGKARKAPFGFVEPACCASRDSGD